MSWNALAPVHLVLDEELFALHFDLGDEVDMRQDVLWLHAVFCVRKGTMRT